MDVPLELLSEGGDTMIRQLTEFLRKKHISLLFKSQSEIHEFIDNYIDKVLKKPQNLSEEMWTCVKYISYVFAIIFNLDPSEFPKISLVIPDGELFATSIMLKTNKTTAYERSHLMIMLFDLFLQKAEKGFDTNCFYSTPYCFYLLSVPSFIGNEMNSPQFAACHNKFFCFLLNLPKIPNAINYSNLLFLSETLTNMYKAKIQFSTDAISSFSTIFKMCKSCPSSALSLFFQVWFNSIRQATQDARYKYFQSQKEQIIKLFDSVSMNKFHELNRAFTWFIVFYLDEYIINDDQYSQQLVIINLLSNAMRHIGNLDKLLLMNDAIQRFSESFKQSYEKKGAQCHILTMLTSLQQSLSSLKSAVKKLQAIAVVGQDKSYPSEKVYFIDQVNSGDTVYEYDRELFSIVHYKCFATTEEADKFYMSQLAKADEIRGKLNSIAFFFFQLMQRMGLIYASDTKKDPEATPSVLLHYIVNFTKSWIDFILLTSYHYMCIALYKPKNTNNYSNSRPEEIFHFDFSLIFNKIMMFINELPSVSYRTIASLIVSGLADYHKKNMITVTALNILDKLPHNLQSETRETKTIFAHVVALMMSHAYEEMTNLNTRSFELSESLFRWSLLTMRIGKPKNPTLDTFFGSLTLFYFKVIVTSIFSNTRWATNQGIALKTAQAYIDAENEVHPELPQRIGRNTRMNLRIISFDDIRDSARLQAASAFLDYFQSECDTNALPIFKPAFEAAFKSGDAELITKAAIITHKYIIGELPNKWSGAETEEKRSYFRMYFDALSSVKKDDMSMILKDIPFLTPLFLNEPQSTFNHFMNANIEDLNFNLTIIMQQVSLHAKEDEDDYRNIFALLTNCFAYIQRNILAEKQHIMPIIRYAVNLLCQCFAYDSIYNTVRSYAAHLNDVFVPPFARGDFDLYFLCLLGVIGDSRSEIAQIASDLAICFLESSKEYGTSDLAVKMTVANFLAMFSSHSHLFSCLTGLSLFNRYFPGCIILDYVRSFIVQLTDIPASETHFFSVTNQFLKNYLSIQTRQTQAEFVQMVYDVICPLSTPVRIILLKRLDKLNVKLPLKSWSEISTQDTILFIQRVTLVFTCGADFDFQITENILTRIAGVLAHKPEHVSILEHFARMLQLTLAITPHKESLFTFINNEMIISQLLNLICNSLTSHYKPVLKLAKKVISKLKRIYQGELYFSQQIYEYCSSPEKIFSPFSPQPERIGFYRRLSKYLPDKVSINIVELFTNALVEYEKKSNLQKIKYMPNCIQFIKALTVRELMQIDIVSDRMNETHNGTTCLQTIIDVFIKLVQNPEIPFIALTKKHLIKFICIFADPAVQYICFSSKAASPISISLFTMLIESDKSLVILKALNRAFMSIDNLTTIHPSIFSMLRELASKSSFAALQDLQEMVIRAFDFYLEYCIDVSKPGDDRYEILVDSTQAMIYIIEITNDVEQIFHVANVFAQPILMESDTYHLFINASFHKQDDHFKEEMFNMTLMRREHINPCVFGMLLTHCIMKSKHRKPVLLSFWDRVMEVASNEQYLRYAVRAMYHLAKKQIPPEKQLIELYMGPLKTAISSPDPETVVYAIRLSTILLREGYMSPKIFWSFSSMLLTYSKFLEHPYGKYLAEFVKEGIQLIEQKPTLYIKTFTYYFHNRSTSPRDFIRVGTFLLQVPKLLEYLPFSFAGFMTNLMAEDSPDKNELFMFLFKFFSQVPTTYEEFQKYADVSIAFLTRLFSKPSEKKEPSDNFYMLLSKSKYSIRSTYSSFSLIPNGPLSVHSFGFVCISMKYITDEELASLKDVTDRTIKFIEDPKNFVNPKLFSIFTERILKDQNNWQVYGDLIISVLNSMLKNYSEATTERVLILIYSIIKAQINIEPQFNHLFDIIETFCLKYPYRKSSHILIQYILKCIEEIHFSLQPEYIDLLIKKISLSKECIRAYSELISQVFLSKKISPVAKTGLSEIFPLLIKELDAQTIKHSISIISQQQVDFTFLIRLNLVLAKQANPTLRIQTLDAIRQMLPKDSKEAIVILFDVLNAEYWTNDFVPLIVSLVSKKVHFWQPLFALSSYFVSIGSELVWPTFQQIITDENVSAFRKFYTLLVSQKSNNQFSSIINGISRAFMFRRLPLPSETVQVAAFLTGEFDTLSLFMKPDSISTQYLLPHRVNDTVFGLVKPHLSLRESSAMALTMLNQYEVADSLFIGNESPIIQKVHDINSRFLATRERETEELTFKDIFKTMLRVGKKDDDVLHFLALSATAAKAGQLDKAKELIKTTEKLVAEAIHGNNFLSIYSKERICVIMNITTYLKQVVNKEKTIKFGAALEKGCEVHCLNPVFMKVLEDFEDLMNDKDPEQAPEETNDDMFFFVDSSYAPLFKRIVGRNSRGLIAIGEDEIRSFFDLISQKTESETITIDDLRKYAPFCYNCYCIQPSFALFQSAFISYKNIFLSGKQMDVYCKHEAATRLITLIRFVVNNENHPENDTSGESPQQYIEFIQSFSNIFTSENAVLWCFWLQQIVELSKSKWFFDMACSLFNDMSYRSTLYGKRFGIPYFTDIMQKRLMEDNLSTQIVMMNLLMKFFDTTLSINFNDYSRMKKIYRFAQELSKLSPEQASKIDFFALRKKTSKSAITQLEKILSILTLKEIENIDFHKLYNFSQSKDNTELMNYIQEITGSQDSYEKYTEIIRENVMELNKNLPFIFSIIFDDIPHISIIRIHEDINIVSENIYLIHATTATNPRISFLVQQSNEEYKGRPSVMTLSNIILFFRDMLRSCYQSRTRGIKLQASHLFEVGQKLTIVYLPSEPVTLEELFIKSTMKTPDEWIDENIVDGELTPEGEANAKLFDPRVFQDFMLTEMAQTATSNIRINLLHSFAASHFVRELLSATYPTLGHTFLCYQAALLPMIFVDFNESTKQAGEERESASSRLSPNVINSMGFTWRGEYVISISSSAQALVSNIESVRAFFELYIGDIDMEDHSIQNIRQRAEKIENKLLALAPPSVKNCPEEVCDGWLQDVEKFIEKALSTENQPFYAIPWF